jgi:class 3 adenylate cyclase/predicted ATPase
VIPMRCAQCGFDNPAGMKFCGQCGAPLAVACAHCGFANPPGFKYCGQCAAPLAAPAPIRPAAPVAEAERRHLTVLFSDLVGSTALAERLDPEELHEVLRAYQQVGAAVIERNEGMVAQIQGDGIVAYFGYPRTHEDEAQRAVRAALALVDGMQELNARLRLENGVELAVRIALHTGLVVIGEFGVAGRHEQMAMGGAPNVAARLQQLAEPNSVVISAATYELVRGYFECQYIGRHTLKGVSQPIEIYRVLRASGARSRLDVAIASGLTPFVGRETEVEQLFARWTRALAGEAQFVVVSAEAGMGKSRLLQVLHEGVAAGPHTWLECRCLPYYQNSALYPVIDLLQRLLDFRRDEPPAERWLRLERFLDPYELAAPEPLALLGALLSLPGASIDLPPQRQKQSTLETILALLLALSRQQPLVLVVEDLHWADPSTLELLGLLVDGPEACLLTLFTTRPEFEAPWPRSERVMRLALTRLNRGQVERVVAHVSGGKPLPEEVVRQIVERTDGVPLFVEELTKMVLESELLHERAGRYELDGPLPPLAIPATLRDSLMARLDRLASVREVAQLGATIGREFSYELLHAVSPLPEHGLQEELGRLAGAGLLYQSGAPPQATYIFKHALIQETAYRSLLRSTRQQYHLRIARVLEERFPETVATEPELLAHHYTESGLADRAVTYWERAGRRAAQRSAYLEAIRHFTLALEQLATLPPAPERDRWELSLQTALGPLLIAIKGYAAPEVEHAYARARELCREIDEPRQLFAARRGLWAFYVMLPRAQTARELAEECLDLAQQLQDPTLILDGHRTLGSALFYAGEFDRALGHFEQAIALYTPDQHAALVALSGQDAGATSMAWTVWTLWYLGYPDRALARSREALALARELQHPFTATFVEDFCARLLQFRGDAASLLEQADLAIARSSELGFAQFAAQTGALRGWALAALGDLLQGAAQLSESLTAYRALGGEVGVPYFTGLVADVHAREGRAEEGLELVNESLAAVERYGHRYYEAELNRLRGELLLRRTPPDEDGAEVCFRRACAVAAQQGARSLELRAALSLARWLARHGCAAEARAVLGDAYARFTEGFDTTDLRAARALLEELA